MISSHNYNDIILMKINLTKRELAQLRTLIGRYLIQLEKSKKMTDSIRKSINFHNTLHIKLGGKGLK